MSNGIILFFESAAGQRIKNAIIGAGAAVVILGALFKLMSWPYAGEMLIAGLGTEAFLFLLLGVLPPHPDLHWEKFYPGITIAPGLEDMSEQPKDFKKASVTEQLDEMLEKSQIETRLIDRLGTNLGRLGDNVEKMSELGDASVATTEYSQKTREAIGALTEMKSAYENATNSITALGQSTEKFQEYQDQIQAVSSNLASLNSVYETELQQTASNLKDLNANISGLNNVYGNMLSAMSMGGQRS